MCEITALAPQKYRVEILGYDSLLVESFICNTYEECGKEALEEAETIQYLKTLHKKYQKEVYNSSCF